MDGEEEQVNAPGASVLDGQVTDQIAAALGPLMDAASPAAPAAPQDPAPAAPAAPQDPAPAAPAAPAEPQPQEPGFTTEPTSADTLKGLFARREVQPADAQQAAEIPPDDPLPEPEHMDDKARNAWVESRNREKQLRQALAQLKKQNEDMAAKQTQFQTEHDELAKALKDKDDQLRGANEKLGRLDLSGSVEFRQRFDEPVAQAEANLDAVIHDSIAGADTPEQVARIRNYILGDDTKFRNYIAKLGIDEQGALIEKRRTLKEMTAQREQALADWQRTAKGLSDTAASANAAEQALRRQRSAEEAIRFNTSDMPVNLRPYITTDEAFADEVKSANEAFTAFMQTATQDEMAKAAHLGHFVPGLNRALMIALREARELQEELYRMRGIRNVPTRTSSPRPPAPKAEPQKPLTASELGDKVEADIAGALAPLLGGQA